MYFPIPGRLPPRPRSLEGSKARLEDLTGTTVDLLAYPSGHHDPRVRAAAVAAGYRAGFTFVNGRVLPGTDPMRVPRLTMSTRQHRVRWAYQLARPPSSWTGHDADVVLAGHE